jgi:hypothetical protein
VCWPYLDAAKPPLWDADRGSDGSSLVQKRLLFVVNPRAVQLIYLRDDAQCTLEDMVLVRRLGPFGLRIGPVAAPRVSGLFPIEKIEYAR